MSTRKNIVQATIKGIEKGQRTYEKISGGDWVWDAAEYWLTVNVAMSVAHTVGHGLVTVEHKSNDAFEQSGRHPGRPIQNVQNKKLDVLIWFKNGVPRAPIEIKSTNRKGLIVKDVERVRNILSQSNMKFGVVAYYCSRGHVDKTAKESVKEYAQNVKEVCQGVGKSKKHNYKISSFRSNIHGNDRNAWIAGCILIEQLG